MALIAGCCCAERLRLGAATAIAAIRGVDVGGTAVRGPVRRRVRADLIDPLCVAALNTPASQASATVFLRVLRDALFGGPGSSADLLLLARQPVARCFRCAGLTLARTRKVPRCGSGQRVQAIARAGRAAGGRRRSLRRRVLALQRRGEAARLAAALEPRLVGAAAAALRYEPIATVYLRRSARTPAVADGARCVSDVRIARPVRASISDMLGRHRS